jgi:hypothetical protein
VARLTYLELLDPRGQPRARVRIDAFPATLGRGYDNDVIIDDPYVCPRHARLVVNGARGLIVEDVGSINGLHGANGLGRQARLEVLPGQTFRVGHTVLRLCDAEQSVAPAIVDHDGPAARLPRLLTTRSSIVICLLSFAAFAMQTYLGSFERVGFANVLSDAMPVLLLVALWGGAWALASRIVSHRFNFAQHLAVVAAVGACALIVDALVEWMIFLFPSDLFEGLRGAFVLALSGCLLYGHLSFASTLSRSRRWAAALGVTGAIFALVTFVALADEDDYSLHLDYPAVLKPVSPRWLRSVTIDDFAKASERLKASVDSLADE